MKDFLSVKRTIPLPTPVYKKTTPARGKQELRAGNPPRSPFLPDICHIDCLIVANIQESSRICQIPVKKGEISILQDGPDLFILFYRDIFAFWVIKPGIKTLLKDPSFVLFIQPAGSINPRFRTLAGSKLVISQIYLYRKKEHTSFISDLEFGLIKVALDRMGTIGSTSYQVCPPWSP
jgi:hypothetical protein